MRFRLFGGFIMRTIMLYGIRQLSFVLVFCFCVGLSIASAKQSEARGSAKSTLFNAANTALKNAESKKADLFSPEAFKDGMKYYKKAETAFQKGKDLAGIEEKLERAIVYFEKATETSGHAAEFFNNTKQARDDAYNVNASKYENETWEEADEIFKKGISRYEDGNLRKARVDAKNAESLYRTAELETIKTSYLKGVRRDIEKLKDIGHRNNAQKIFKKAETLANRAAEELEKQRYSNNKAKQLAREAGYEIKHAKYVHHHVRKMKDADYTFEDVIIESEKSLTRVSRELGITPKFNKGLGEVDRSIVDEIRKLKFTNTQNEKTIAVLNDRLKEMELKVAEMNDTGEKLRQQRLLAEKELEKQKMHQLMRKKKIRSIRAAFSHSEGKVLMDGDNIIIRLYGLNFPSGKSVIEPQYFGLLTRVKKSFNQFKACDVVIEGHTDSLGSDSINQTLSEQRATAVKQYILANSSMDEKQINAIGYGETKPVASNETASGQAKNRRIDVVIIPARS